jgi:L-2-hydroxyglutarate oxidase LhgO
MDQANIVIIGGGVVGCAIARSLSARWPDGFCSKLFQNSA